MHKLQWQQMTAKNNLTSSATYLLWEVDSHAAIPPSQW